LSASLGETHAGAKDSESAVVIADEPRQRQSYKSFIQFTEVAMPQIVLSQYRDGSEYKDQLGVRYHFPKRYLSRLDRPESEFVYYEPRNGGKQVYFGYGQIGEIAVDSEKEGHYFAEVRNFRPFSREVSYWDKDGNPRESASTMRSSVRSISSIILEEILRSGGLTFDDFLPRLEIATDLEDRYGRATPIQKRFIAGRYERPNAVTNAVKQSRGSLCQVCSEKGFAMRNGKEYCEVHHLFHLAKQLPGTLSPKYLIVVCANCHRKLHYGNCTEPEESQGRGIFKLDGADVIIPFTTSIKIN
jgi:HNH endonuclease